MINLILIVSKKNTFQRSQKTQSLVIKFVEKIDEEKLCECAASIVQYGWKKEAVPIVLEKKSLIGRIFHKMFS